MPKPLLVGIDVHQKRNMVCLMDQDGTEVAPRFSVSNNRPGAADLIRQVAQRVAAGEFDAVRVAAEATGWYWWHLFQTLLHDPLLAPQPLALYALNPRLVATFSKTYTDRDHTDRGDAFVIADRLRLGRDLPQPFHTDERYAPVRLLTRYRYHLVHTIAREKTYCLSVLYLKASEYSQQPPFSNIFGVASQAVLQEFASLEAIAAIPFDDLVAFIDAKGKGRFAEPAANAKRLLQVVRDSYPLPGAFQQPVHHVLRLNLQHITFLEKQEQHLNRLIAEAMTAIPHTLETIPGIGPTFAAGMISEIGDVTRFQSDPAKVAKFAGFKWHKHQSGNFQAEETRLTRTGNPFLRYYFCEGANAVRMRDATYHAFYERKVNEVRLHQHKRAVVLTARKLIRLVVRLLTTNQPYQPGRAS